MNIWLILKITRCEWPEPEGPTDYTEETEVVEVLPDPVSAVGAFEKYEAEDQTTTYILLEGKVLKTRTVEE